MNRGGHPLIKDVSLINYSPRGQVVILERVEPGQTPEYCVHGKATCLACDEWVWLGDQTHDIVKSGKAAPLCMQCAQRLGHEALGDPTAHLEDHRRADGPH